MKAIFQTQGPAAAWSNRLSEEHISLLEMQPRPILAVDPSDSYT